MRTASKIIAKWLDDNDCLTNDDGLEDLARKLQYEMGRQYQMGYRAGAMRAFLGPKSPSCPLCGAPVVLKTRRFSAVKFWGCSDFPNCRWACDTVETIQGKLSQLKDAGIIVGTTLKEKSK